MGVSVGKGRGLPGAAPTRTMYDDLFDLLSALDGVRQDLRYHPESDALYHSLQTFQLAYHDTDDPTLHAAALLHDVGKAHAGGDHAEVGAELLDGLIAPDVVWLVGHHLDLLRAPGRTRRRLRVRNDAGLARLERLRRYDVAGRDPRASVLPVDHALSILMQSRHLLSPTADPVGHDHAEDL